MKSFSKFPEAFDYCREKDQTVIVLIAGDKWKVFTSGKAELLQRASNLS